MRYYLALIVAVAALFVSYPAQFVSLVPGTQCGNISLYFPVGCYVPAVNEIVPYNKSYTPESGSPCASYYCSFDGKVSTLTCKDAPPGCINVTLPYQGWPLCCYKNCSDLVAP